VLRDQLFSLRMVPALALVVACQPPAGQQSDRRKGDVADSAKAVAQRVIDNSNRMDWAAVFRNYSNDPDAKYVENGVVYPSLQALEKAYAEFGPTLELVTNSVDAWDVVVLGPEAASVMLPIHLRIKAKGRPEAQGQLVWSAVIQRRNGRWQVVQSHESWQNAQQLLAALAPASAGGAPK
jgi:ketosteroid isomerase-like protein